MHQRNTTPHSAYEDPILQADWMLTETPFESIDDLHQSDPELFDSLATEWRNDNPWDGLGN